MTLSRRTMRRLDLALAVWAALWIGLGAWTGYEVNALRTLSVTVVKAGVATESVGKAIEAVGSVPFVGGSVAGLGRQAVAAGRSAQASGRSTRGTIDTLAILLGLAIGLVPTVPLLALYLPLRRSWRRERRAVSEAIARWDGEPDFEEYLAQRALMHLPYAEQRDLQSRDELADAELRRLGLDRAAGRTDVPQRTRVRA